MVHHSPRSAGGPVVWICLWFVAIIAFVVTPGYGANDDGWQPATMSEFRQFARNVLPTAAVEAVYRAPAGSISEVAVGVEFSSGAWYIAGHAGIAGRDQEGRWYRGGAEIGGGAYSAAPDHADFAISGYLPATFLILLPRIEEHITSLERSDAGDWRVAFTYPAGVEPAPAMLEISTDGFVRRLAIDEPMNRTYEWSYPDGAPSPLVPPSKAANLHLADYEIVQGRKPGFADLRVTEKRAAHARLRVEEDLAASAQGFVRDAGGNWTPPQAPAPAAQGPLVAYRLPLIIVGIIILVIAAIHIARRHMKWNTG